MRALPVAAALLSLPLALAAQSKRETAAATALAAAMELVEKGQFAAARAAYRQVVVRFPGTGAAIVAEQRTQPNGFLGWACLVENGPSRNRVDVVVMGDGYTLEQQNSFADFAKSVPDVFRNHKVLGEYFAYHNFARAHAVSREAGMDGFGREYDTALGGHLVETIQGHVAVDGRRVRAALDELPEHDGLAVVFVKRGTHGTGGGGIAVLGGRDDDTLVHEWGHAFGGLGDEYDGSTGPRGAVGRCANVSDSDDPAKVPWRHFLDADVPGVGVYRGADGRLDGAWKPSNLSAMSGGVIFCPVCREQLVLRIYSLVDPIDACEPAPHPARTAAAPRPLEPDRTGHYAFRVEIMVPATHGLDVRWWVLPQNEAPDAAAEEPRRDRRQRGPLPAIAASPKATANDSRTRAHTFRWKPPSGAHGRFRVVCRVRDQAKPAGQQVPWVLSDPAGVLESERGWWIEVGR